MFLIKAVGEAVLALSPGFCPFPMLSHAGLVRQMQRGRRKFHLQLHGAVCWLCLRALCSGIAGAACAAARPCRHNARTRESAIGQLFMVRLFLLSSGIASAQGPFTSARQTACHSFAYPALQQNVLACHRQCGWNCSQAPSCWHRQSFQQSLPQCPDGRNGSGRALHQDMRTPGTRVTRRWP